MKLRVYLVDDEPLALGRLKRLLDRTGRVEVIGSTTEPEKAVAELKANPPDVCFLDIEMPRLNGFGVLTQLSIQPIVIFTTAYDHYALQAFGVNSVDYLLKPIETEALERAISRADRLLRAEAGQPELSALLQKLTDSLRASKSQYPVRIASRLGERLRFLDLARVTHFYSEDKLTYAVCDGKSYCIDDTITALETRLHPKHFVRIHRSTMVNLDWIKEVTTLPGGSLNIRLRDARETDLTVARDRAREFKQRAGA